MTSPHNELEIAPRAAIRLSSIGIVGARAISDVDPPDVAARTREMTGDADRFDISSVQRVWPGIKVSSEPIEKAGYLLDYGSDAEIVLRRNDGHRRQRFTFAHELGHWLTATTHSGATSAVARAYLERWCDNFAASLLVPPPRVKWPADLSPVERLQTLIEAPDRFDVSAPTAYLQISEVNATTVVLVQHRETRPTLFGASAVSAALVAHIAETARTSTDTVAVAFGRQEAVAIRLRGTRDVVALVEKRA